MPQTKPTKLQNNCQLCCKMSWESPSALTNPKNVENLEVTDASYKLKTPELIALDSHPSNISIYIYPDFGESLYVGEQVTNSSSISESLTIADKELFPKFQIPADFQCPSDVAECEILDISRRIPEILCKKHPAEETAPADDVADALFDPEGESRVKHLEEAQLDDIDEFPPPQKENIPPEVQLYSCSTCSLSFPFEERLKFHEHCHTSAGMTCDVCQGSFNTEQKLYHHYQRCHTDSLALSCLPCGKSFPDVAALRAHLCANPKPRKYVCEECNKGFSQSYALKRHAVTHLPEKPFKCGQCPKSFTQKSRLKKHVASHGVVLASNQRCWKCSACGRVFPSREEAENHVVSHGNVPIVEESTSKLFHCEFCNSFFVDIENLRLHEDSHAVEAPFQCASCSRDFTASAEAILHWKSHPSGFGVRTVFACIVCNRETVELARLIKHRRKRRHFRLRLDVSGTKKYVCELCGVVFSEKHEILGHGKGTECAKFPCDICGSRLSTENSLQAHKRRHNGLLPYVCNVCSKSYSQSSHLQTHKRLHMEVKPYDCEFCDAKFVVKQDLADHTRTKHTKERPFKCEACGKSFLTGSVFYQHRLIHRVERKYRCYYCNRGFVRVGALNNHVKIHTGEKPHACSECGKCFRQKRDMRKHVRTQHTGN